jgi:hypothetical protein
LAVWVRTATVVQTESGTRGRNGSSDRRDRTAFSCTWVNVTTAAWLGIPRAAEGGCQIDDPVEKPAPWEIASRFPTASTPTSLTIVMPFWKMQLPASSRPRRRITSVLDPQFLGLRGKGYGVYALMLNEF